MAKKIPAKTANGQKLFAVRVRIFLGAKKQTVMRDARVFTHIMGNGSTPLLADPRNQVATLVLGS
jgi:hypothetical protein